MIGSWIHFNATGIRPPQDADVLAVLHYHKLDLFSHLDEFKTHFCEIVSAIVEKSVNFNFMGGSFSISYDSVENTYNLFQDSFERFYANKILTNRNFLLKFDKKYLNELLPKFDLDSDLEQFRKYCLSWWPD